MIPSKLTLGDKVTIKNILDTIRFDSGLRKKFRTCNIVKTPDLKRITRHLDKDIEAETSANAKELYQRVALP